MSLDFFIYLLAISLPLSRALISFLIIFIPIFWLIKYKEQYRKIFKNKILLSILIFLIYYLISFLWTQDDIKEGYNFIRYIFYWSILFSIAISFTTKKTEKVISLFLIGMFISEIISYGVFFGLWHFKSATHFNPSPFMFWIDYSIFLAFTSLILLNKILSNTYNLKNKIGYSLFFITVTGNLFLSIGRTGQLAFMFAIFILFLRSFKNKIKAILVSFLLVFLIFTVAYNSSQSFNIRVHQATSDIINIKEKNLNSSWGIRIAYWIVSYEIIKKDPIFGVGLGDYQVAIKKELENGRYNYLSQETIKFMKKFHPHNQYLLILLQSGFIGLFLFVYLLIQLFKLKIKNKELKNLSIIFLSIYCIGFMAEPLLIKQFTLVLFIFFNGIFINNTNINKSDYE